MKLNEDQEKWLAALESGQYRQGKRTLVQPDNHYCCLGVACKVFDVPDEVIAKQDALMAETELLAVRERLRLRSDDGEFKLPTMVGTPHGSKRCSSLARMNDSGFSFVEIAGFIRANPETVFTHE